MYLYLVQIDEKVWKEENTKFREYWRKRKWECKEEEEEEEEEVSFHWNIFLVGKKKKEQINKYRFI